MSRTKWIATSAVALIATACNVHPDSGIDSFGTAASGNADSDDTAGSDGSGEETGGDATANGDADDSAGGGSDGGSSTGSDPSAGDDDGPHGQGNCGGTGGDPNGFGFVPRCPSDPQSFYERYLATRGQYYHDGVHAFEPGVVEWDDAIAAKAQEYAESLAAGMAPMGEKVQEIGVYDPYWDGSYAGYRAIAGTETPTSCTCSPQQLLIPSEAYVFYNVTSTMFRASVVRMAEVYRMGVGHVGTDDGQHYWALLFSAE